MWKYWLEPNIFDGITELPNQKYHTQLGYMNEAMVVFFIKHDLPIKINSIRYEIRTQ